MDLNSYNFSRASATIQRMIWPCCLDHPKMVPLNFFREVKKMYIPTSMFNFHFYIGLMLQCDIT